MIPATRAYTAPGSIAGLLSESMMIHKGTQFVFGDLSTYKPGEWNVYSEVKRKLIEDYGIRHMRFVLIFRESMIDRSRENTVSGDERWLMYACFRFDTDAWYGK